MKHTLRRFLSLLLCAIMVATMVPMAASTAVSAAESSAPMLAYVPLDNRPVVYQRVEMAAGAAGFDIRVPEERLFATKLDGQGGTGVNGSQHGDGAAIMNWLDAQEAAGCNYYIIHLDQMLSGGLVGSRHPDKQTVTDAEANIINRLLALTRKTENKVYFIDIVMRLASTGSYKGYESAQYDALRNWGSKDRLVMDATPFSTTDYNTSVSLIDQIHSNYKKDKSGNTIAYDTSALTSANVSEYLAFRKRKLTLMNMVMQELDSRTTYLVGVDDSSPNKNIQWNELMFLDKRAAALGLDYTRMSDTDSIGLMAVARCVNDLYGVRPKLKVRYFGNKADATDDYGNDTLRQNVDKHIECLNAQSVETGAEVEVLVLTQPDSSYSDSSYATSINNLVSAANANIAANIPTIVIEVSEVYGSAWAKGYTNLQDELFRKVSLGKLMGYSNWNTVGNAIGIALGIGVSRYSYIRYEENIAPSSHNWHLQSIGYAYVKDICYNARHKLSNWEPMKWTGSFNYWLDKTKGFKTNNHYQSIVDYKGSIEAGRVYINNKLELFMKGRGEEASSGAGTYETNANAIAEKLMASQIYTNLNRTVQTMEIDSLSTSNYYFPWDRMFEIYFDVSGSLGNVVTYYTKDTNHVYQIPVSHPFSQFSANAKSQYGASAVTVKNLNGTSISGSSIVGTDFTVTMTVSGSTKTYRAVVYGDTNGTGTINTLDVRQTMQKTLGQVSFSEAQAAAADLDGNSRVSSTDARRMLQIALS